MKPTSNNHEEELKKAERIAYLIAGHINNSLTPAEADELDEWVSASDENLELFEKLTDEDNVEASVQQYLQLEKEKANAYLKVKEGIGFANKRKGILHTLLPYLVAASVLAIAATFYFSNKKTGKQNIEKPITRNGKEDMPPGKDKAVLVLENGRSIILDSSGYGELLNDDGVIVKKLYGGELSYHSSDAAGLTYHTLSIPRGGKYTLKLPDGSTVWLNAESSLRYPTHFTPNGRNVELRGEGYFEVAKNVSPFSVKIISDNGDAGTVKVLGTHFNINGYGEEGVVKTTLLEGTVEVEMSGKIKILKPGEQALIASDIKIIPTNVNEAVAWKDGRFLFRNAPIKTIGEQIKRWYDVEVIYEGRITQHFNAEMSRDLPLSKLLDGLEGTMQVDFTLEGKTLTIKP